MAATLNGIARRLNDAKYWFLYRFHPRHRYHLVNTGLGYGYHDCDTRMLHALMALLCEHVEIEHGGAKELSKFSADLRSSPDQNAPKGMESGQADRQDEALAIYDWWKHQRPADEKRRHDLLMECYGPNRTSDPAKHLEFDQLQEKIDSDEESMLLRLMAIRGSLWT